MFNRLIYQGRLTEEPTLEFTKQKQTAVIEFTLASQSNFKDEDGEYNTNFQKFKAYGNNAEFIAKHFKKGQEMIVEAVLEDYYYLDKNNNTRKGNYGLVREVNFCGKPERRNSEETETTKIKNNEYEPPQPEDAGQGDLFPDDMDDSFSEDISDYNDFI